MMFQSYIHFSKYLPYKFPTSISLISQTIRQFLIFPKSFGVLGIL